MNKARVESQERSGCVLRKPHAPAFGFKNISPVITDLEILPKSKLSFDRESLHQYIIRMEEGRLPRNSSRKTHIHHLYSIPAGNNSCRSPIQGDESALLKNIIPAGEKN